METSWRKLAAAAVCVACTGCVERTVRITSEPAGALVWVNDREIGRTPVSFDFVYYGRYDVRLVKEGYEPMLTFGEAKAPLYETIPLDLGAELAPVKIRSEVKWHYVMERRNDDPGLLLERARALRARLDEPSRHGEEEAKGLQAGQGAQKPAGGTR